MQFLRYSFQKHSLSRAPIIALLLGLLISSSLHSWYIQGISNCSEEKILFRLVETANNLDILLKNYPVHPFETIFFDDPIEVPSLDEPFCTIENNPHLDRVVKIITEKVIFYCCEGRYQYKNTIIQASWAQRILHKKMIKEKDPVLYNMGNYAPEKKYFVIVNKKGFLEIREKLPAIQPQVILQEEKKLNKTI